MLLDWFLNPNVQEHFYLSDVAMVFIWAISFATILHIWAAFMSPYYGSNRVVNVLFLRKWYPNVARRIDHLIKKTFLVTNIKTRSKLANSLWRIISYSVFAGCAAYVIRSEDWFSWENFRYCVYGEIDPNGGWPPFSTPLIRQYYVFRLGYAFFSLVNLLGYERHRPDFKVYVVHHFCEISLLVYSFVTRQSRFGLMVFILHDPSDLLLQMAKVSEYAWRHPSRQKYRIFNVILFLSFAISWLILRLILFPYLFTGLISDFTKPLGIFLTRIQRVNYLWRFYQTSAMALFVMLYVLHWFWFGMIVKVAWIGAVKNQHRDARSDEDNDDETQQLMKELGENGQSKHLQNGQNGHKIEKQG